MDKNFDTIRFELFDPYEAKEQWAVDLHRTGYHAVRIYVNDKELNALLVELEDKEDGETTPSDPAHVYGHIGLWLAEELKKESADSYGASLCCCSVCGDEGCWACGLKCARLTMRSFGMASSMSIVSTPTADSNSISSAVRTRSKSKSLKNGGGNTTGEILRSLLR